MADDQQSCPLCGERAERLYYQLEKQLEQGVVNKVLQQHPAWVRSDGICDMCLNYFRNLVERRQIRELIRDKVGRAHHRDLQGE